MQNIVLFALVFVLGGVHASHYRGGTFSYEKLPNIKENGVTLKNRVRIKWRLAAKRSWGMEYECRNIGQTMTGEYNGVLRCIDCAGESKVAGPLTYDCVGYSETQDWSVVEGYANFTSDRPQFTLFYQVEPESQCKAASNWIDLVNAAGRSCWRLVTKVDLEKKNQHSPVVTMLPVFTVRSGCRSVIPIEASDPDGDVVRCRWAVDAQNECPPKFGSDRHVCGRATDYAILDQDRCELEFPKMGIPGWYAASVMVEDFKNKKSKEALSTIPFQFLLNVTEPGSCVGPLVQGPSCDIIRPGEKWTGVVTARILPASDAETIIAMPMSPPAGMKTKITTSLPSAEAAMELEYQAGRKEGVVGFCYTALDNNWVQSDPVCGRIMISKSLPKDKEEAEPAQLVMDKSIPKPGAVYGNKKGELPMPKKWRLVFNKPVARPRRPAYARLKYRKGYDFKELAKFNFADPNEVQFLDGEESARIEFSPPLEKFKDGVQYFVEIDAGTAIVYKPDPCGNAPAESPNPGLIYPFQTAECKPKPPPEAIPEESIPSPDFETAKEKVWKIKFNKKIVRPSNTAFIKILELPSQKVLAKYDASKSSDVEFPSNDPTILRFNKPEGIEDGMLFTLQLDGGVVMAVNPSPCRSEMGSSIKGGSGKGGGGGGKGGKGEPGEPGKKPNPPTSWGFKSPPPPEPYVDCGDYSMTFHVPHKYVDDMAPELLHLHDPSCTAKSRNSKWMSVTTFYDECGTKSKRLSQNEMRYINTLRSDPKPIFTGAPATRKPHTVDLKFVCDVTGTGVNDNQYNSNNGVETKKFTNSGDMRTYLKLYSDSSYSKQITNRFPNVSFTDVLYFAGHAENSAHELEIESCRAFAKDKTCTRYDDPYVFIENGCPVDPTVRISGSGNEKRFSITSFGMIQKGLDHNVIVRCRMVACDAKNADECADIKKKSRNCPAKRG